MKFLGSIITFGLTALILTGCGCCDPCYDPCCPEPCPQPCAKPCPQPCDPCNPCGNYCR